MASRSPANLYDEWAREYGAVFCIRGPFGAEHFVLCDPKAIAHVLALDSWKYHHTPVAIRASPRHFRCAPVNLRSGITVTRACDQILHRILTPVPQNLLTSICREFPRPSVAPAPQVPVDQLFRGIEWRYGTRPDLSITGAKHANAKLSDALACATRPHLLMSRPPLGLASLLNSEEPVDAAANFKALFDALGPLDRPVLVAPEVHRYLENIIFSCTVASQRLAPPNPPPPILPR
ncbi:hypothetical protein B0H19DRAFT_1266767 [Mycena capillaripes]|nr:hypothetical protein B0H19DRAFT_1266767 [Mycena capillaripes]